VPGTGSMVGDMATSDGDPAGSGIQARLRRDLVAALRARDQVAIAALRTALSTLGNAEAVPVPAAPASTPPAGGPHIAGAAAGLGAAEAARRHVDEAEAGRIVRAEISERLAAAEQYERGGRADRAARLRHEAAVLIAALGEPA
jgi:uncharacterized protein